MTRVFVGGSVFDGQTYRPGWEVAIDGASIVAVGPDLTVSGERVDLRGGLIAPGFIDAHNHPAQGGLEHLRCDLSGDSTKDAYLARIKAYADAHPEVEWILGGGWAMSAFPGGTPLAEDLDRIVPDRPVYLPNKDHHGVWVNSCALERAGVTAETPDPDSGYFERDADGNPTGTVHEGAVEVFESVIPRATVEECYEGLLVGQALLHAQGITGWQDAIFGPFMGTPDVSDVYLTAAERETLTAHVVGALWWDRDRGVEQLDDLVARRTRYTRGRLRASSVKIMQDGVAENFTAAMLTPYLDKCGHPTGNRGHSFVDGEALKGYVAALAAEDFQVHVHAIGDRGVREALDAFAHARGVHPGKQLRHHIAHLQVIHPDDVPRFAELNVAANMQMLWACWDDQMAELTVPFLGEPRVQWQYPFGDLARAGAHLAAGSDWPVSSAHPLEAMHVAVNRWEYGAEGRAGSEPFLPAQALSLEAAMAAYTSGSAWLNHREHEVGTLAPGMRADLAILDRDPFAGPSSEIGATGVVATYVDGQAVFES